MIEIKYHSLVFSFPELHKDAVLTVSLQRTLRIPDDGRDYPLPPGLGRFPLRHIDDCAKRVPASWLKRGGVLMPMWQSEALWLSFYSEHQVDREHDYPFAVKVATGKVNAITGEPWQSGLKRNPQNYLVVPVQPWLDGYCVEKGFIRQFVAMPLGAGYSVEEQITGKDEFGGLQIEVLPMRKEVFEKRFPIVPMEHRYLRFAMGYPSNQRMGLAPGGRMRQEVYEDPFSIHDWDTEHSSRCFLHLVNSAAWQAITRTNPPSAPLTAQQYTAAGYPWFDFYDAEAQPLAGSAILARLKSVKVKMAEMLTSALPDNQSLAIPKVMKFRRNRTAVQIREGDFE